MALTTFPGDYLAENIQKDGKNEFDIVDKQQYGGWQCS
jgi:hypothetical protein